ncbi:hypothetical protein GCM10007895_22890 [Paraferrimonas sedimenticola]|uniref:Uncharacterized protein n=1 Tax=Paraferrimonas sedimenticola TaxID=375674 RepID=A0AA37RXQ2_9GAMM|nr:hypothetical protein GCM10007895_22890 [Paraferrimonas sedimenticola]
MSFLSDHYFTDWVFIAIIITFIFQKRKYKTIKPTPWLVTLFVVYAVLMVDKHDLLGHNLLERIAAPFSS